MMLPSVCDFLYSMFSRGNKDVIFPQKHTIKIDDIKNSNAQYSHVTAFLDEVASKMWEHNCYIIPIVDDHVVPVGIVSDRDIAMACLFKNMAPWEVPVSSVIDNKDLYICSKDDDIDIALAIMKDRKVRNLPVAADDGSLVGMLSIDDILELYTEPAAPSQEIFSTLKALVYNYQ